MSGEIEPAAAGSGAPGAGTDGQEREAPDGPHNPRLRLVGVERIAEAGSRIRIRVRLELAGNAYEEDSEGLDTPIMALRLAAEATLAAAGAALGDRDWLELVGVKLLHAFDADVILIAVRSSDEPGRKLVGAVPAMVEDRTRAAVTATLDAINRVVGPRLAGEEGGGA